jgi:hypothetical protein
MRTNKLSFFIGLLFYSYLCYIINVEHEYVNYYHNFIKTNPHIKQCEQKNKKKKTTASLLLSLWKSIKRNEIFISLIFFSYINVTHIHRKCCSFIYSFIFILGHFESIVGRFSFKYILLIVSLALNRAVWVTFEYLVLRRNIGGDTNDMNRKRCIKTVSQL